ncbi:MAG: TetR/AcrR family transcriptional regulator [Egibacteraceae bacterium]
MGDRGLEAVREEDPSSPRAARTAARLRQAARLAFDELGWQQARVEDIVRRASVSHGTFYTYYESKAAILDALLRASQADFEALALQPWEADDVRGALERVIGGFLDLYRRDGVLMRVWLQAARDEPAFADLYLQLRGRFVDRVTEHIAAVVAVSGREGTPPACTVASALVAMVEHFAYTWAVLGEPHERDDAVATLVLIWGSTLNALAGFDIVHRL